MRSASAVLSGTLLIVAGGDTTIGQSPSQWLAIASSSVFLDHATVNSIAVAPSGVWLTGFSCSPLQTTPDALIRIDPTAHSCQPFLARVEPNGAISYLSYLHEASTLAIDRFGYIYVAGSREGDGTFLTKLSPDGRTLLYSHRITRPQSDVVGRLAVDTAGRVHVVGRTSSSEIRTAGAPRHLMGRTEAFYARFSGGGLLEYGATLGGVGSDSADSLALDESGNAFVGGRSDSEDFLANDVFVHETRHVPTAWVARFSSSGLQGWRWLGGTDQDLLTGLAVSRNGRVFAVGRTTSCDFPMAPREGTWHTSPSARMVCSGAIFVSELSRDVRTFLDTGLLDTPSTLREVVMLSDDTLALVGDLAAPFPVAGAETCPRSGALLLAFSVADVGATPRAATCLTGQESTFFTSTTAVAVATDTAGGFFLAGHTDLLDFPVLNGRRPLSMTTYGSFLAHLVPHDTLRRQMEGDIVLHTTDTSAIVGGWALIADMSAASARHLRNEERAVTKLESPLASPQNYVEFTFQAEAGVPYHLWLRMKADADHYTNDSVYVQFSDAIAADGKPAWGIGTASAMTITLEDGTHAGLDGWGWADGTYGAFGEHVTFGTSGSHTVRIQQREDGVAFDQLVLSRRSYLTAAPGVTKDDTTLLLRSAGLFTEPPPEVEYPSEPVLPFPIGTPDPGAPGTPTRPGMLWHHQQTGQLAIWELSGPSVVATRLINGGIAATTGWTPSGAADLDADGGPDIVWRHSDGKLAASILKGTSPVATELLLLADHSPAVQVDSAWQIQAVGDLNGDGRADLVWQHPNGQLGAWFMNGFRVLETTMLSVPVVIDRNWRIAAAADLDADGKADIVWQHPTGALAGWLMDGAHVRATNFLSVNVAHDVNWRISGATDVNDDGHADLLWQHADGRLGVWYLRGFQVTYTSGLSIPSVANASWKVVGPG